MPHLADEVVVRLLHPAHVARRREVVDQHAHRHAGAAAVAGGPVGDGLRPAEAAMGQHVVELARPLADQVREDLSLLPARQVGARVGAVR